MHISEKHIFIERKKNEEQSKQVTRNKESIYSIEISKFF